MSYKVLKFSMLFAKNLALPNSSFWRVRAPCPGPISRGWIWTEFGQNSKHLLLIASSPEFWVTHLLEPLIVLAHTAEELSHCRHVPDSLLCCLWSLNGCSLPSSHCSVRILPLPVNSSYQGPTRPCASACLSHNEETAHRTALLSTHLL